MLKELTVSDLIRIESEKPSEVCIYGAGENGRTVAYDFISYAGIHVDFYCDSYVDIGTPVREGVCVDSINRIKNSNGEVLVFIAIGDISVVRLIYENIKSYVSNCVYYLDDDFYCHAMSQIDGMDDSVKNRFNDIYDDETYLKTYYYKRTGKKLDLNNPVSFNEKLQWLKLHDRRPLYTKLADKISVKDYVKEMVGDGHVIDTLSTYNSVDEIDISLLPDKFVLKCSHDGGIIVCDRNAKDFDIEAVKKELKRRMRINYYWYSRGWCYKNIIPRIICEPYVVDESGVELKDYKVFCFNGKTALIQVDFDRFNGHKRNLYSTEWELIDGEIEFPSDKNHIIARPKVLEDMLDLASRLSKGIPHVRTDFYICNDTVLLGEMTFFHGSGCESFRPESMGIWLGSFIDLDALR